MRILIISPYFAPFTGVGALRMTSLAEYLIQNGHAVTVVKMDNSCYGLKPGEGLHMPAVTEVSCICPENGGEAAQSSIAAALEQCGRDYDCMIVSCGPYYTLKPVLAYQKETGIPLVVDYRDLWLYDPRPVTSLRFLLGLVKERLTYGPLERELMKRCAAFVTVTPGCCQIMEKHYPFIKGKSHCIYNGYSEIALPARQEQPQRETFDLCFLGKLGYYAQDQALVFFRAVKQLLDRGYPLRIVHVGTPEAQTLELIQSAGIPEECFCERGQMPYSQALAAAGEADMFVAIISYASGLGTKLFDYIYLNKPILGIAPANSEFEALLQSGAENWAVCQTQEQIMAGIQKIVDEKADCLTKDPEFCRQFSRQTQNGRFLKLLERICRK